MKQVAMEHGLRRENQSALASFVVFCLLLLWCEPSRALVVMSSEPLRECGEAADLIVVAHVVAIDGEPYHRRIARATVQEIWRGAPGPEVRFCADNCPEDDYSYAQLDERVLLCMTARADMDYIVRNGTARFEITENSEGRFVVLPGPPQLPIPQVPVMTRSGVKVIGFTLADIKKHVLSFSRRPSA